MSCGMCQSNKSRFLPCFSKGLLGTKHPASKRKRAWVVFQRVLFGFIYFYADDDWKIKVTRRRSLMDTPTAAPRPGNRLTFVVE